MSDLSPAELLLEIVNKLKRSTSRGVEAKYFYNVMRFSKPVSWHDIDVALSFGLRAGHIRVVSGRYYLPDRKDVSKKRRGRPRKRDERTLGLFGEGE